MAPSASSASATAKTRVRVSRQTPTILGWPSDAFSIDHHHHHDVDISKDDSNIQPHTALVFVPGNPGLIEWYIPLFEELIQHLGPGYCARGVANAGHSIDPDRVNVAAAAEAAAAVNTTDPSRPPRDVCIPWSVDGQALHKAAYIDLLLDEFRNNNKIKQSHDSTTKQQQQQQQQQQLPHFIFIAHSIGVHFTQRVLLFRPDIMARTQLVLALMPFIRMQAPWKNQTFLNFAASIPETTVWIHEGILRILSQLPVSLTRYLLRHSMKDPDGLAVATQLVRQPPFARNFFLLGTEEIRDVPECLDGHALNYITSSSSSEQCPIAMLFAANDQWAPLFHLKALRQWHKEHDPNEKLLSLEYNPALKHDFVSVPEQVAPVVEFCLRHITKLEHQQRARRRRITHRSRL